MELTGKITWIEIEKDSPAIQRYLIRNWKTATFLKKTEQPLKSFLIQFSQIFGQCCNHQDNAVPSNISVVDTGGTLRTVPFSTITMQRLLGSLAGATTSTYGLIPGTGTNAVTPTDNKLQTQIAHGTGANQLSYGATSFIGATSDSAGTYFGLQRTFTNNSGGDITVRELAWYTELDIYFFAFTRDLSTQLISAGSAKIAILTVTCLL